MVPPTPVPVYKRRSFEFDNAGSRFSAIERGPSGDWQSGDSARLSEASSDLDVDSPGMSPLRGRRLFTRGERIRAHAQSVLIGMLICFSIWAWQPVALWAWARAGGAWAAPTSPRRAPHDIVDDALPHVYLFNEPGCTGENVAVALEADLCHLRYPSGPLAKDNVASVLLTASLHSLRVFGTCRLIEKLPNPMLLETVTQQGCVDLKYPIVGSVQLRPNQAEDEAEQGQQAELRRR